MSITIKRYLSRRVSGLQQEAIFRPKFAWLFKRQFAADFRRIMACLPYYAKGDVIKGFGRGSKELGIPTANLPDSTVNGLPAALDTGIYYGLSTVNNGIIYKTVLSLGWNPFYHNTKKSLEAHLIHNFDNDFYGAELRLVILGYIRPEKNYASMELLIEAINNDIEVAKTELDKPESISFHNDPFFHNVDNVDGEHLQNGFDLYSACDVIVGKKNKEMVPTQIAITVPLGSYGRIAPRSGLAKNNFIDVGAGVIDHDYTGEVKVLLFNFSNEDFEVKKGHRIAQLVIEKIFMPELKEVEDLPKTKRGATGFGASGK